MRLRCSRSPSLADSLAVSYSMTAAILVGGLGTRLRSIVADTPKCLALINGEPFLLYLLRQLTDAGIDRILLCTGYGADQVEKRIGNRFSGIPVFYSREEQPLGTAGALRLAFNSYGSKDDSWFVANGDSFLELDFKHFKHRWKQSGCAAGIAAARVLDGGRFGGLRCSPDGRVLAFKEKSGKSGEKWINGGVYLLSGKFLAALPEGAPSLERDVFPACIETGLMAYPSHGRFIDIGVPESFTEAQTFFAEAAVR